jgi:hypothetical protein
MDQNLLSAINGSQRACLEKCPQRLVCIIDSAHHGHGPAAAVRR